MMTRPGAPTLLLCLMPLMLAAAPPAAAQAYPIQGDAGYRQATRLWQQDQREQALEGFQKLCDAHAEDGLTWLAVADFLSLNQGARVATPFAEGALALVPENPDAYLVLTQCRIESGDYEGAEATMQAAVDRFPPEPLLIFQLGSTKAVNKKLLEARACFKESARLDPKNSRVQFALGTNYAQTNEFALAERHLKRACRTKDKHPDAPWNLAQVIAFQERPDEAEPWFQKGLTLPDTPAYRPSLQQARHHYGVFLYEQRRHAEAEALFQKVLEVDGEDRMAWQYLARVQNALGKRDEARAAAQRYRELQTRMDQEEDRYLRGLIDNLRQFRQARGAKPEAEDG